MKPDSLNRNEKDLNRLSANIIKKEVNEMKKEESSDKLKKAFDKIDGCVSFDGNGADLAKVIRKNGLIKLKGA